MAGSFGGLNIAISSEAETRKIADNKEAEERIKADANEATVRELADNAELERATAVEAELRETIKDLSERFELLNQTLTDRVFIEKDLADCPEYFSEYTESRGYFLRVKDETGVIDPEGLTREIGSVQSDLLKSHAHTYSDKTVSTENAKIAYYAAVEDGSALATYTVLTTRSPATNHAGGVETRSKNILIILCTFTGI